MHEKKIQNLMKLNPYERYDYFIRHVSDSENLAILTNRDGQLITSIDHVGENIVHLWSDVELADYCMFQEQRKSGAVPKLISVETLFMKLVPDMQGDGIDNFGIFFKSDREGLVVSGKKLKNDLVAESIHTLGVTFDFLNEEL